MFADGFSILRALLELTGNQAGWRSGWDQCTISSRAHYYISARRITAGDEDRIVIYRVIVDGALGVDRLW